MGASQNCSRNILCSFEIYYRSKSDESAGTRNLDSGEGPGMQTQLTIDVLSCRKVLFMGVLA